MYVYLLEVIGITFQKLKEILNITKSEKTDNALLYKYFYC